MSKNTRKAFILGVRDGWEQPHYANTTRDVDALYVEGQHPITDDVYTVHDRGINLGQFLRAGRKSEAWRKGFAIPFVRKAVAR